MATTPRRQQLDKRIARLIRDQRRDKLYSLGGAPSGGSGVLLVGGSAGWIVPSTYTLLTGWSATGSISEGGPGGWSEPVINDGYFDSANNERITVPSDGLYLPFAYVTVGNVYTSVNFALELTIEVLRSPDYENDPGSNIWAARAEGINNSAIRGAFGVFNVNVAQPYPLQAGDYLRVVLYHTRSSSLAPSYTRFGIAKLR